MQEIDVDGKEVKLGRLMGIATYFEHEKEWRALIALNAGGIAVCTLQFTFEPMWEDREV